MAFCKDWYWNLLLIAKSFKALPGGVDEADIVIVLFRYGSKGGYDISFFRSHKVMSILVFDFDLGLNLICVLFCRSIIFRFHGCGNQFSIEYGETILNALQKELPLRIITW